MMKRYLIIIINTLLASASLHAVQSSESVGLTQKKLETEQLPDLNIPRYGHCTFIVNGELTVIGGHTTGFVPTTTAEYFSGGMWHTMHTVYAHDYGIVIPMKSGKVLACGGANEPLGIGQTYPAEWYDPTTHTFEGFGSMDMKRCNFTATEIDSGRMVISGNWFSDDCIELFDGHSTFVRVKDVAAKRSCPYILRTAKDNVMIFSSLDTKHTSGIRPDSIIVDQLWGEPFHAPLLDEWRPLAYDIPRISDLFFIGDETAGDYAYLLPVKNTENQIGFVKTCGTDFSLLSTTCTVPMMFQGDSIQYHFPVVDRQRGRGYLVGFNRQSKQVYVLRVDYTENPAPLTFYYTDPLPNIGLCWPVLNDDGNLILAGGLDNSNYYPLKSVVVLRINPEAPMVVAHASFSWLWIGVGLVLLAAFIVYLIIRARRATQRKDDLEEKADEANETEEPTASMTPTSSVTDDELLQRVCQLMEEERLYLNSGLKISDVAMAASCNRNVLSACINNLRNCSFSKFVNTYRVEHAKQLLSQPDTRASEVWMETGFANETTFFRAFKAIVGMTPSEWKSSNHP